MLVLIQAPAVFGQADRARVIGTVIDASGGALPGVSVTLAGSAIAPTPVITDEAGRYVTPLVPPGTYNVSFELSGFESRQRTGLVLGAGQTVVLDQQLALAPLSETVEVTAPAPAPPRPPKPPPPPRPKFKPTEELLAPVCGPREPPPFSISIGKVVSHRDDPRRQLLGPGDPLRIDTGNTTGLIPGQTFAVRRRFQTGDRNAARNLQTFGEQSVALIQITDVSDTSASALVVYACGEIVAGDSVEPYVAQPASFVVAPGDPNFDQPAKIAFGEFDRSAGATGQMMVIDRGLMQGIQRGQQVTIFRRRDAASPRNVVGSGVIVAVRPDSATLRIDRAVDAVMIGDLAAPHK